MIHTENFCTLLQCVCLSGAYSRFQLQCKDMITVFEKKHSKEAQPGYRNIIMESLNWEIKSRDCNGSCWSQFLL